MVFMCISHPPGPIFHARYLDRRNSVGAKKVAFETPRGELSEDVSFGIGTYWHLLALSVPSWLSSNRAWKTAPGLCDNVIHTIVSFGIATCWHLLAPIGTIGTLLVVEQSSLENRPRVV